MKQTKFSSGTEILRLSTMTTGFHSGDRDKVVVLIGSYAPVHQGHVELLANVANWYLEHDVPVRAVVMAPNSEAYVRNKLTKAGSPHHELASIRNRLDAITEFAPSALPDSNVMTVVDDISCMQVEGLGFINNLSTENIASRFGCRPSDIVVAIGADQLGSMRHYWKHNECVVVSRPGQNATMFELLRAPWVQRALRRTKITIIDRPEGCVSLSSTAIRAEWSQTYRMSHLDIPTTSIPVIQRHQIIRQKEDQLPLH